MALPDGRARSLDRAVYQTGLLVEAEYQRMTQDAHPHTLEKRLFEARRFRSAHLR